MADPKVPQPYGFDEAARIARAAKLTETCAACGRLECCRFIGDVCADCIGTPAAVLAMASVDKPQTLTRDQAFRFRMWKLQFGGAL